MYWLFDENNVLTGTTLYMPGNFTGIIKNNFGDKYWLKNGCYHRIGGAAKIFEMPYQTEQEYWVDNKQISKLEHDLLFDIMKLKGLL